MYGYAYKSRIDGIGRAFPPGQGHSAAPVRRRALFLCLSGRVDLFTGSAIIIIRLQRAAQKGMSGQFAAILREEEVMKSRTIAWTGLGLVVLMLAVLVIPVSGAEGPLSGVKVCLDPGHGGTDPGAVNDEFSLHESDINLDVSLALMDLLKRDGAEVVMTRTGDSYLDNSDRYTFCNAEQATILVSVHTNSIDNDSWDGSMGLYVHEDDKALAKAIHEMMYPMLREALPDDYSYDFADWGLVRFNSGVLLKSDMPAAMMEPLFMSNEYEAPLLEASISEGECPDLSCRRGQIATALHQGILHYFDTLGRMHIGSIEMWEGNKGPSTFVYTRVTILAEHQTPVSGAVVSLETTQPKGPVVSQTGMTGADGTVTFQLRAKAAGLYRSTVTDVSMSGWEWDASGVTEAEYTLE
jgi:N-acetylmuramoyl-L-alanine amidase